MSLEQRDRNDEPLLAAQSAPHMFQNATRFGIQDSHFTSVQGNMNIHPTVPLWSLLGLQQAWEASQPLIARPPSPPTQTTVYSESGNYSNQLLSQGRGFPLYIPKPDGSLPVEYRRGGVAIGDVGTVTADGSFDFFFNIYLPADHPINAHVPENFEPLRPYNDIDVFRNDFDPGNYVSSFSIRETNDDFTESSHGGTFVFAGRGPNGAVLALPHGAHLQKLRNIADMRQYATRHAERWYKHVNEARGRGLVNGSLYLVTGCEKAKSWGMASFCGVSLPGQNEFQLSFRPTDAETGRYRWKAPNCRHKHADLSPVDGTLLNQTTFIHAFAISLSETIWGSLFGRVEISQLADASTFLGNTGGGFIPYGRQGSSSIWSLFGGSHGTTGGGKQCSAPTHGNVILSDASPIPRVFHPSQIIHERILREVPQARVVITHDDDWRDIFMEGGMGMVGQNLSELQQAIFDCSEIFQQDGAVFLRSKFGITELGNKAISLASPDPARPRQEQQLDPQHGDGWTYQSYRPHQSEMVLAASNPVAQDPTDPDTGEDDNSDGPSPSKRARTDSPTLYSPAATPSTPSSASTLVDSSPSANDHTKEAGTKGDVTKGKERTPPRRPPLPSW
ncbi:WD40 containing domain protein [Mycena sanguinolenta]|uniref:WD40 containing domain protein n=1 Tax=Mycena sanguinolenta TaxID=230812 RepID=A0A8H7DIL6_9AGAR|nr:WD40 containing domain protein [Mycena sanguinolenta]